MKRAAIGVRVHSGWGALVAVAGDAGADGRAGPAEVVDRRRIVIVDPRTPGASQPYHRAREMAGREAEDYLVGCAAASARLALAALQGVAGELRAREVEVAASAILLASGRPLPALPEILASHALIHTAEGEFFRGAFRQASEELGIPTTGLRERDLDRHAEAVLGRAAASLREEIARLGKALGPPWTQDQKAAALAAWIVLAGEQTKTFPAAARGTAARRKRR